MLERQEETEREKRLELRSAGEAFLSKFNSERKQAISARQSANREAEKAARVVASAGTAPSSAPLGSSLGSSLGTTLNSSSASSTTATQEESWTRVCDLIDFTKDGVQRDTSRMKHILLQLKTSPIPAEEKSVG